MWSIHVKLFEIFTSDQISKYCLNIFSVFSSGGQFIQQSRMIWAILVEGIMGKHWSEITLNLDQWLRCLFKDNSYLELLWPFVPAGRIDCAILVEGIKETLIWNYFEFGLVVQEMLIKDIS